MCSVIPRQTSSKPVSIVGQQEQLLLMIVADGNVHNVWYHAGECDYYGKRQCVWHRHRIQGNHRQIDQIVHKQVSPNACTDHTLVSTIGETIDVEFGELKEEVRQDQELAARKPSQETACFQV